MFLAGVLPPELSENAIRIQSQLTIFGIIIILGFAVYRSAILQPNEMHFENQTNMQADIKEESRVYKPFPLAQYLTRLFFLQGLLFYFSILFFYTLESMTRLNPRLQALQLGQILAVMEADFLQINFLPWVLFSLVGVGLGYFSFCHGRYPTLPKLILPKPRRYFQRLLHNYLHIVVDAVMLGPFIWLLPLGIIWLAEAYNSFAGQESLFHAPLRSMFILGLLCIVFKRTHRNLLDAMERYKIPLGMMLVVYIILASLLVFVLHVVSSWLIIAFAAPTANESKSLLAQALTEEMQDRRLSILVWSWWSIWLPWMASNIAGLSVGRKLWVAFLLPLIFPTLLWFAWQMGMVMPILTKLEFLFQFSLVKLIAVLPLIIFLLHYFSKVYSFRDFECGGMLPFASQKKERSLKKWLNGLIVVMTSHLIAIFMMGWVAVQILTTLGAMVMVTVLAGFIVALLSSKDFLSVLKRYKVLAKPEA